MEIVDEQGVKQLRKDLKEFSDLDDEIKEINKLMKPLQDRKKELTSKKKELEKGLCETMEINNYETADVAGVGTIEYRVTEVVVPVTQKTIKEKFILFFESGPGSQLKFNSLEYISKGEELYNYIYMKENRDKITREKIVKKKEKN